MFIDKKDLGEYGGTGKTKLEEILKVAREEYGLLSLTDVVLNRTANDSPWLFEHPDAGMFSVYRSQALFAHRDLCLGYSPSNTPHWRPALELVTALLEFSATLESRGLPNVVTSEQDIARILEGFENHLKTLNMWQYYVLDVKRERSDVKEALDKQDCQEDGR